MAFDQNQAYAFEKTEQGFIQRVYQWMAAGLAITGAVSMMVAGNPGLLRAMSGGLFFLVMIAELGIVIWLSSQIMKISASAAITGFVVYSILNGLTLSFIFLVYTAASVSSVFFITAGTFAAVSLFGWTTKSDLTSARGFLVMGLIGVLIASLVNLFLNSPVLYWIISYVGIAVFIGLTAYDTQKLKEMHRAGAASDQLAIMGALQLYLDFVNLFLMLLRLFGRRR